MVKCIIVFVVVVVGVRGFISFDVVLLFVCNCGFVVYEFGRGKLKGVVVDFCVVFYFCVINIVLVVVNDCFVILLISLFDYFVF